VTAEDKTKGYQDSDETRLAGTVGLDFRGGLQISLIETQSAQESNESINQ
jgi:hypothetical protein